jgi:hypothetical protein
MQRADALMYRAKRGGRNRLLIEEMGDTRRPPTLAPPATKSPPQPADVEPTEVR